MQEGAGGVKRGQIGYGENHSYGKMRRREGIKRGLRDILPVSYEEYDTSWDHEDQSKRCKKSVNCLLVPCTCEREAARNEPMSDQLEDDVTPASTSHTTFLPVRNSNGTQQQPVLTLHKAQLVSHTASQGGSITPGAGRYSRLCQP